MNCPVCGGETGVTKSRPFCDSVARCRKCKSCNYIFYTEEVESSNAKYELARWYREIYKKSNKNEATK